jgi:hypothetical protein
VEKGIQAIYSVLQENSFARPVIKKADKLFTATIEMYKMKNI